MRVNQSHLLALGLCSSAFDAFAMLSSREWSFPILDYASIERTLHHAASKRINAICIDQFICDHLRHMHASYVLWNKCVFTSHGEKDYQLKQLEHRLEQRRGQLLQHR